MGDEDRLVAASVAAREFAYAPYSDFAVGAAVLTEDGTLYSGCNVENVTYGMTTCAEQTAMLKAVSEGHRSFTRIAVCTDRSPPATPCGLCRQMLAEFCDDIGIILVNPAGERKYTRLSDILPHAFRPRDLIGDAAD
jgi:cytidine deaminase